MFRRLLAAVSLLVIVAILLVIAWPQLFGLQRTIGVAHLVSFRGLIIAIALALVLILAITAAAAPRVRAMATSLLVLLLVFAAVNTVVVGSRGWSSELGTASADAQGEVTVLSWNTLGPATSATQIAELALEEGADVVVLPETTQATAVQAAAEMREQGRPMSVLARAVDEISPALTTSMLVSVALGEYAYDASSETTSVLPTIVARPLDGSGPTIVAVHAVAPTPAQLENWRGDLEFLASSCPAGGADGVIMAGDFNATIDHFSGLGTEELPGDEEGEPEIAEALAPNRVADASRLGACADAAARAGGAAVGTWPTRLPALLGAPIDHVMVTDDISVLGFEVLRDRDDAGSDHRPVVARLGLPN